MARSLMNQSCVRSSNAGRYLYPPIGSLLILFLSSRVYSRKVVPNHLVWLRCMIPYKYTKMYGPTLVHWMFPNREKSHLPISVCLFACSCSRAFLKKIWPESGPRAKMESMRLFFFLFVNLHRWIAH